MAQSPLIAHDLPLPSLPMREGMRVLVVGDEVVLSSQSYDENQYWFPFMNGVMFLVRAQVNEPIIHRAIPADRLRKKFAAVYPENQRIYHYERDVHQHVLPFVEFKAVSNRQNDLLRDADYPSWDRDSEGKLLAQMIQPGVCDDPRLWGLENLDGRFYGNRRQFICEKEIDALRVRLTFG